jgi:hypothetical protein
MSDDEINAAIAESLGWSLVGTSIRAGRPPGVDYIGSEFIPNYCADLNAMHEAEKVLAKDQWEDFVDHLVNDWSTPDPWKEVCHATARQRAEAFLRTLGKWKEAQL